MSFRERIFNGGEDRFRVVEVESDLVGEVLGGGYGVFKEDVLL